MARVPGNRDFRWLFDAAVEAMLLADSQGAILARNPSCECLFGYSGEEWARLSIEDLIPERFRAAHCRFRAQYAASPVPRPMGRGAELRALRKDGSELPVRVSLSVVPDRDEPLILAVIEDVSTQHAAEEALRENQRQLREREALLALAVEATGLAPWEWNPWTDVVNLSPEWKGQLGYAVEEMTDHVAEWRTRLHPNDLHAIDTLVAEFKSGKRSEAETKYRLRHRDGSYRWMQTRAVLLSLPGSSDMRLVGMQWDVTEQMFAAGQVGQWRAEEGRLRQFQVALETAAAIAHELNQPLNAIVSFSEAAQLLGRYGKTEKLDYALSSAVAQAERAGRVMRDLLRFLEQQEMPTAPNDLQRIVREAITLVMADSNPACRMTLSVSSGLPPVLGNEMQIKKVLTNLLRNAAEAIAAAGQVDGSITVTLAPDEGGTMAQVSVKDSGPGPDAATADRMFEPFFTTKARGIGMGLATSRRIIKQHGGRLWFDATDGGAFHLTLPIAP